MRPCFYGLALWVLKPFLLDLLLTLHHEQRHIIGMVNDHKAISKNAKRDVTAHLTYAQLGLQSALHKYYGVEFMCVEVREN